MFFLDVDEREEAQSGFLADIKGKLQSAFHEAKKRDHATFHSIGQKLGINRSAIYRQLKFGSNLTAKSISDLAWALGKKPTLLLVDIVEHEVKTTSPSDVDSSSARKLRVVVDNTNKKVVDEAEEDTSSGAFFDARVA